MNTSFLNLFQKYLRTYGFQVENIQTFVANSKMLLREKYSKLTNKSHIYVTFPELRIFKIEQ